MAAGALSRSLIGRIPRKAERIGPVAGVSLRVASRMANSIGAGYAVRGPAELTGISTILFHSPPDQSTDLAALLAEAPLNWPELQLLFFDCEPPQGAASLFRELGATVGSLRSLPVPEFVLIEGAPPVVVRAQRLAAEMNLKPLDTSEDKSGLFDVGVALGTFALTPLINRSIELFRSAGLRDKDAVNAALSLFQKTVRDYAHSGRQSWEWHVQAPDPARLETILAAAPRDFADLFHALLLEGFHAFGKHQEIAERLKPARDLSRSAAA